MSYDFIGLGDITTDAFIKLTDQTVDIEKTGDRKKKICFNFGDKLEYEELIDVPAVGNSPNAAVSAHRLGLKSAIATNTGADTHGKLQVEQLEKEGVGTDFVRVHENIASNYHFVLWYEEERTILVKHHEYPYEMPDIGAPQWLYLSSLGEHSLPFHHTIAEYVQNHEGINLAFQPGTFQIRLGYEKLKDIYAASKLFFCNRQEAQRILETDENDMQVLLAKVRELGPDIAVITDGPEGAYAADGDAVWHMPMYPDPAPPVDRTGAGDSFSSTFTSMLGLGYDIKEALRRAPINSMSVVQYVGAQEGLLTMDQLEEHLANAPADYEPTQLA